MSLSPRIRWIVLIFIVACATFFPSLDNAHVFDDLKIIQDNIHFDTPWAARVFFGAPYWHEGTCVEGAALYRPLTIWSFALDHWALGGPFGVHLVNVLLNGGVAILAFLLLARIGNDLRCAAIAALIFAVHPVHVEVVSNGVGRAELLSAALLLGAALSHLAWQQRSLGREGWEKVDGPPSPRSGPGLLFWGGAAILYFLALCSKESAAVLPGLLFLNEWIVAQRGRLGPMIRRAGWYVAYALPLGAYVLLRGRVVGTALPAMPEAMALFDGAQRVLYASELMLRELVQLATSWPLSAAYADYRHLDPPGISDPWVLASLLMWVFLAWVGLRMLRRGQGTPVFGLAWFFLALLPTSHLFFPVGTVRAERLLFVPSLGFIWVVAWLCERLIRKQRALGWAVVIAMVVACGVRSVGRNRVWTSTENFWQALVRDNPGNPMTWHGVGELALADDRLDEAEAYFSRAAELRSRGGGIFTDSRLKLAEVCQRLHDPDDTTLNSMGASHCQAFVLEVWEGSGELRNPSVLSFDHRGEGTWWIQAPGAVFSGRVADLAEVRDGFTALLWVNNVPMRIAGRGSLNHPDGIWGKIAFGPDYTGFMRFRSRPPEDECL